MDAAIVDNRSKTFVRYFSKHCLTILNRLDFLQYIIIHDRE